MTIDPDTLPDGTVTEFRCDTPGCDVSHFSNAPRELFHGVQVVRTFSPDPLPSQEVPRLDWHNIKKGSRVQIEHAGGTVVVGEFQWCDEPERDEIRVGSVSQRRGDIARVFVLDEPADPDAEAKAAIDNALPDGSWTPELVLANLRAAGFDVVKAGA